MIMDELISYEQLFTLLKQLVYLLVGCDAFSFLVVKEGTTEVFCSQTDAFLKLDMDVMFIQNVSSHQNWNQCLKESSTYSTLNGSLVSSKSPMGIPTSTKWPIKRCTSSTTSRQNNPLKSPMTSSPWRTITTFLRRSMNSPHSSRKPSNTPKCPSSAPLRLLIPFRI